MHETVVVSQPEGVLYTEGSEVQTDQRMPSRPDRMRKY